VWGGVGGGDADFFAVVDVGRCREGHEWWIGERDALSDGFGCFDKAAGEFVAIWLGADISLQSISGVFVYFATCKS
jgi:hypothetical protein